MDFFVLEWFQKCTLYQVKVSQSHSTTYYFTENITIPKGFSLDGRTYTPWISSAWIILLQIIGKSTNLPGFTIKNTYYSASIIYSCRYVLYILLRSSFCLPNKLSLSTSWGAITLRNDPCRVKVEGLDSFLGNV